MCSEAGDTQWSLWRNVDLSINVPLHNFSLLYCLDRLSQNWAHRFKVRFPSRTEEPLHGGGCLHLASLFAGNAAQFETSARHRLRVGVHLCTGAFTAVHCLQTDAGLMMQRTKANSKGCPESSRTHQTVRRAERWAAGGLQGPCCH